MMRIPLIATLLCSFNGLAWTQSVPVHSSPAEAVAALVVKAKEAYAGGEVAAALRFFLEARALSKGPTPRIAFNLAQCYRNLGEAEQHAGRPKATAKHYENAIQYYRHHLREWPLAFAGEANPYEVEASSNMAALSERLVKALHKAENETLAREKERRRAAEALKRRRTHASQSRWAYITLGTAGAAAIATAIVYGVFYSKRAESYQAYRDAPSQDVRDLHFAAVESADRTIIVGHVIGGLSAALVATSAILFVTRPDLQPAEKVSGQALSVSPTFGNWGLQLRGAF